MIAEQFRQRMGFVEAPSVSIEIAKFRPFYITGDVQHPGEYAYRPGLTVLQALSLAGGYYRDTTITSAWTASRSPPRGNSVSSISISFRASRYGRGSKPKSMAKRQSHFRTT